MDIHSKNYSWIEESMNKSTYIYYCFQVTFTEKLICAFIKFWYNIQQKESKKKYQNPKSVVENKERF